MLDELGWDAEWAALAVGRTGEPARVVRADGSRALVATATGEARVTGAALVTGDWVLCSPEPSAEAPAPVPGPAYQPSGRGAAAQPSCPDAAQGPPGRGTVVRLPRRTELVRGAGGKAATRQVLAANVDLVFVLVSLAAPPSEGRLDRLLAVAWDSGARPVVVLTKADLAAGTAAAERDEVAETAMAAPVLLASTVDGRGLAELRGLLRPGVTAALLGVSGAGKSSLLNALAGTEVAEIGELGRTGKGRHTTTARELTLLPGGGLLLDTPGLRGVQLWAADGGLDMAFADIVELAGRCRFTDCRHAGEPGCAIAAAVADGTLSARRVASHASLRQEVGWLRDRYDARQRAEQRREWKQLSKAVRAGRRASPRHGGPPRAPGPRR
jgi:ribosome biogenesis GTPase / thiamine phosphate phosphatase